MWHLGTWAGGGLGSIGRAAELQDLGSFSNLKDSALSLFKEVRQLKVGLLKAPLHLTPVEFKAQNLKGTSASLISCARHAVCGRELSHSCSVRLNHFPPPLYNLSSPSLFWPACSIFCITLAFSLLGTLDPYSPPPLTSNLSAYCHANSLPLHPYPLSLPCFSLLYSPNLSFLTSLVRSSFSLTFSIPSQLSSQFWSCPCLPPLPPHQTSPHVYFH